MAKKKRWNSDWKIYLLILLIVLLLCGTLIYLAEKGLFTFIANITSGVDKETITLLEQCRDICC